MPFLLPKPRRLLPYFLALLATATLSFPSSVWADPDSVVEDLLARMTPEEKAGQLIQIMPGKGGPEIDPEVRALIKDGGVGAMIWLDGAERTQKFQKCAVEESRLGIPLLVGLDVIHGYRTVFPVPIATACSWDLEAIESAERIAAIEASAAGINWTFAPMVDIARDPRWGRIVEGAGEDPYLGAMIAAARVRGFQGDDLASDDAILACAKHFVGYGAAEGGRDYNSVDISDRMLREVYLPPFHAAANAGVGSAMSAFNDISGVPATGNEALIRGVFKDEWEWPGFVVSDWDSIIEMQAHSIAASPADAARIALIAGVDMDMNSRAYYHIPDLIKSGQIDAKLLDDAARRVLRAKQQLGLFEDPFARGKAEREKTQILTANHRAEARHIAGKSIVLLENKDGALPLDRTKGKIAVIGSLAHDRPSMLGPWSPSGKAEDAVTILDGIRAVAGGEDRVLYAEGYEARDFKKGDIAAAVAVAAKADTIILAVGEPESMSAEARSRASIELPANQRALFDALEETGKPIIVLLVSGRPMAFPQIAERADAVVQTWFLGVEMGNAVADVLFGAVNPGGKLAVTFPASTGQIPIYYNHRNTGRPGDPEKPWSSKYIDSTMEPAYSFGHGLSYTTFDYSDLQIGPDAGAGGMITISMRIKNTGTRAGDEVVQLYIRDKIASVAQPVKSLKGFKRLTLNSGESKTVRFDLPIDALSFYGLDMKPIVEPGTIEVMVGSSSKDIRLRGEFEVTGKVAKAAEPGTRFTKVTVE